MDKEAFYDTTQYKGAKFSVHVQNLNKEIKEHPVSSNVYWKFNEQFGKMYGKTVKFTTTEGKGVRGILDNVVCTLIPR